MKNFHTYPTVIWMLLFFVMSYLPGPLHPAAASDWYRWRGPDLNGISSEKGWQFQWPPSGPRQIWKAKVGVGFSSVSVAMGHVYTMGNDGKRDSVVCLSETNGTVLWKHTYDCPLDPRYYDGGTSCTPTIDGNQVYTLSRRGHLFSLDAATGKIVWEKNLVKELGVAVPEWGFSSSPLVVNDLLILNVGETGTAIRKLNGSLAWTSGKGSAGYSAAVPHAWNGKQLVALALSDQVVGIEVANGKVAWKHPWKTQYDINAADPVVHGNEVFISSGYEHGGALIRLDSPTPTTVWENTLLRSQFSTPVLIEGHIYGVDGNSGRDCTLKCLDWKTGALKWEKVGKGMASLMAAGGKLIIQWEKGELVLADVSPSQYHEVARAQILGGKNWTQPVLSNGRMYVRNAAGDLVCVDVSGSSL